MIEKQKQLVDLVRGFCSEKLDGECEALCVKLVEKMGRKHEVPFKRGKLEIWASGVVYAICQINFIFDESFEPATTPDEICQHFKTKKSTASNKARDIRKLLNIQVGDKEFSTERVLTSNVRGTELGQVKSLQGAETMNTLKDIASMIRMIDNSRRR